MPKRNPPRIPLPATVRAALLTALLAFGAFPVASAADATGSQPGWLPSLITETPEEGFALAVKLAQKGVATTQPDASVRKALRNTYAHDPNSLIAVSQVIGIHFQTVAAANDYWKE